MHLLAIEGDYFPNFENVYITVNDYNVYSLYVGNSPASGDKITMHGCTAQPETFM